MQFFIEISSWNLLESFVTESISPFSFYSERNFGNNLSRFLSGNQEKPNHLILSNKDLGGDCSLCVDEALIDKDSLESIKGLKTAFTYPKTIYYRKGFVSFRFASVELRESLIAESQILFEVKCLKKYSSDFYVKKIESKNVKGIYSLKEMFSFEKHLYIKFDNSFNKIKGAVIGYVRGFYTTSDAQNQQLQNELRHLKNALGGLNTQIMLGDTFAEIYDIFEKINKCKSLYFNCFGKINSFDVLTDLYKEVIKLAKMRFELLNNSTEKYTLLKEKVDVENQIAKLESVYYDTKKELESIKALEKKNGEQIGKSRFYFKKGSAEYEMKKQLENKIKNFEKNNHKYNILKSRLYQIEQDINKDTTKYDSALSAIFTRISDIINDLTKNASAVTNNGNIDLAQIKIKSDHICLENSSNDPEICYFNIVLSCILNKTSVKQLSEYYVLQLLEESAKIFKDNPLSKNEVGEKILSCLRTYWAYKNQRVEQFDIPDDMFVFQAIMSFFIKPLGFDQIERYMLIKNFFQKAYAFMLWGACVGFADIPKTFTNILYENIDMSKITDDFLFSICQNNMKKLL